MVNFLSREDTHSRILSLRKIKRKEKRMRIYKVFRSPNGNYVYDRNCNKIFKVSKEEADILSKKRETDIQWEKFKKYMQHGLLCENLVKEIRHPESEFLEYNIQHRTKQIVLQVTQNCNLRCGYCVYSGGYDNRDHSYQEMSLDVAYGAIDYLDNHSDGLEEVVIGFYGGEPLLKFGLIKKCVEYARKVICNKKVRFTITTNGTLLTESIASYFCENDFAVIISLDGNQNEHDRYRKYANGKGSFKDIIENIENILIKIPSFIEVITINAVMNPQNDYYQIKNFFENDKLFKRMNVNLVQVDDNSSKEKIIFDDKFVIQRNYDYFMLLLALVGKINKSAVSKFMLVREKTINNNYQYMKYSVQLASNEHHGGPCLPGVRRLFVTVDGGLYPCERVPETSLDVKLGDINDGIDLKKALVILNIGKITAENCKKCWAMPLCKMCIRYALEDSCISKEKKLSHCYETRLNALNDLKEICLLKENSYDFEKYEE